MRPTLILATALLVTSLAVPTATAACDPPTFEVFGVGMQRCSDRGDTWNPPSPDFEAWESGETVIYSGSRDVVAVGYYTYRCENPGGTESCTNGDNWTDEHVRVLGFEASVSEGQMDGRPGWHVCYTEIVLTESDSDGTGDWYCPILINP